MTTFKSTLQTMIAAGDFPGPGDVLGRVMLIGRAKIDLAAAITTPVLSGDTIELFKMKAGVIPLFGLHSITATLGATATIAYGITGSTAKYKAAAVFETVDTPTWFGKAAAMGIPLSADETLLATVAAANLPTAGTWHVAMFGLIRN